MKRLTSVFCTTTDSNGKVEKIFLLPKFSGDGSVEHMQKMSNKLGKIEDIMEKYGIPNLEYLEQCIKRSDKYGELSEEIGCPLEVRCKLRDGYCIYKDNGKAYTIEYLGDVWFDVMEECDYDIEEPEFLTLKYSDYKKTWWLKADKSE